MNREMLLIETSEILDEQSGYINSEEINILNINEVLRSIAKSVLTNYADLSYEIELFTFFREFPSILFLVYSDYLRLAKYEKNKRDLDLTKSINNIDDLIYIVNDINETNRIILINIITSSIEVSQMTNLDKFKVLNEDVPKWLSLKMPFDILEKRIYLMAPDLQKIVNNILDIKNEIYLEDDTDELDLDLNDQNIIFEVELNIEKKELEEDIEILFETNRDSYISIIKDMIFASIIYELYLTKKSEVIDKLEKNNLDNILNEVAMDKKNQTLVNLIDRFIYLNTEVSDDELSKVVTEKQIQRIKKKLEIR